MNLFLEAILDNFFNNNPKYSTSHGSKCKESEDELDSIIEVDAEAEEQEHFREDAEPKHARRKHIVRKDAVDVGEECIVEDEELVDEDGDVAAVDDHGH
mmetsp:Transcript_373/g.222  ORF Transcript_373/g.222 Transcript_373/m.222 type:complete len:99 (-) Transcript_373:203-499(-)|eukprot:CAMPEP_0202971512 /NCGR_PEP_ID=MMETSP1396-20130829/28130_1 /ASSEMBLY_ACC=CAM_ASM_000872 /TAXON_ID= /ORGANISM="Pseudokeronopsis sp., Strain Brazil" /LENGTH=98 /DNA_ID=CAMNT_0049700979 /DNA_START=87 /DNA_END=383 /DNA_ORIENTATION=+